MRFKRAEEPTRQYADEYLAPYWERKWMRSRETTLTAEALSEDDVAQRLQVLENVAQDERENRRAITGQIGTLELMNCWTAIQIAKGKPVGFLHHDHMIPEMQERDRDYRIALPGEVIVPQTGRAAQRYIVMPGVRETLKMLPGNSNDQFYFMDDFTSAGDGGTLWLNTKMIEAFFPALRQTFLGFIFRQKDPSPYGELLMKAGCSPQNFASCYASGRDSEMLSAAWPEKVTKDDIERVFSYATKIALSHGLPHGANLYPDKMIPAIPDEVRQNPGLTRAVFNSFVVGSSKNGFPVPAWEAWVGAMQSNGVAVPFYGKVQAYQPLPKPWPRPAAPRP